MQCTFENCTREDGHSGPHGLEIQPGLVLAPHGTGKEKHVDHEITNIPCNTQCGSTLTVTARSDPAGGILQCSSCGQRLTFHEDGRYTEVILPRLYSQMEKTSPMWLEYLNYKEYITRFEMMCYDLLNVPEDRWLERSNDFMTQIYDAKRVYNELPKSELLKSKSIITRIKELFGVHPK